MIQVLHETSQSTVSIAHENGDAFQECNQDSGARETELRVSQIGRVKD